MRAAWLRWSEIALVSATGLAFAALALRLSGALIDTGAWWLLPVALGAGLVCADLITGAVHWFCDSFFGEDTPVLGPFLIRAFREHHVDPQQIVRHGFAELNGSNCLPVLLFLLATTALPHPSQAGWLLAHLFFFFLALACAATNQLHYWAHVESPGRVVARLQASGLILSPERHARHHRTFSESYCTTTGWMNPLLDRLGLFQAIERWIRTRAAPRPAPRPLDWD